MTITMTVCFLKGNSLCFLHRFKKGLENCERIFAYQKRPKMFFWSLGCLSSFRLLDLKQDYGNEDFEDDLGSGYDDEP